jgi:hypothetical protein
VVKLYADGATALKARQWERARAVLLDAFQRKPYCQIAANLGWAELMAGKPRDAAEHLSIFLRDAQKVSAADRQDTENMLTLAKAAIGTVTVQVDTEGAEVWVDGKKVGVSPLAGPVFVESGRRTFEARKEGRPPVTEQLEVAAGAAPVLELRTVAKPAPATGPRKLPGPEAPAPGSGEQRSQMLIHAGIGVSAGLAAVGIGTAIGAALTEQASLRDWADNRCTSLNARCRATFDAQEDRRFYLGNTAVWAFVGAAAVGGATAIYALTGRGSASKSLPSAGLVVSPQGGLIVVRGSF